MSEKGQHLRSVLSATVDRCLTEGAPLIVNQPVRSDLTAVHFFRGDRHGVVVVHDDSALMVAAAAGGNGFRVELREPTEEEIEAFSQRTEP